MRPGHVCVLTTAHPIDDVRMKSRLANSFLDHGFEVSWVGPEYSSFADRAVLDPRIGYDLVDRPRSRVDRLGVGRRIYHAAKEMRPVDWWLSPDPDSAEVAVRLARERGERAIFDVHEEFHGALLTRWTGGRDVRWLREYVRTRVARTCAKADVVSGVSESVLRPYVNGLERAVLVRNCAPRWFAEVAAPRSDLDVVRVMHGKAVRENGTAVVLGAAEALPDHVRIVMFDAPGRRDSLFNNLVRTRASSPGLRSVVELRAAIPHQQMPAVMGTCAVGMIAYGRDLGPASLPNRLFEYMAAGLAVLAPTYSPEIRRIIEQERIGLTVNLEDARDIAAALTWLSEHPDDCRAMGERARAAFLARHNWDSEFARLLGLLDGAG